MRRVITRECGRDIGQHIESTLGVKRRERIGVERWQIGRLGRSVLSSATTSLFVTADVEFPHPRSVMIRGQHQLRRMNLAPARERLRIVGAAVTFHGQQLVLDNVVYPAIAL